MAEVDVKFSAALIVDEPSIADWTQEVGRLRLEGWDLQGGISTYVYQGTRVTEIHYVVLMVKKDTASHTPPQS